MMEASQSVPELVAVAKANAKTYEDQVSEILKHADGQTPSDAQLEELRIATAALEAEAVDIFTVFEARMQHHFRRGPFSRKLEALLKEAAQADLADSIHQYYLTINVLKHGKGASYRELLNTLSAQFRVKPAEDIIAEDADTSESLIEIAVPGFFDGLTATILEAYDFLEKK